MKLKVQGLKLKRSPKREIPMVRSAELQLCAKQSGEKGVTAPSWSSALLPGGKLKGRSHDRLLTTDH